MLRRARRRRNPGFPLLGALVGGVMGAYAIRYLSDAWQLRSPGEGSSVDTGRQGVAYLAAVTTGAYVGYRVGR